MQTQVHTPIDLGRPRQRPAGFYTGLPRSARTGGGAHVSSGTKARDEKATKHHLHPIAQIEKRRDAEIRSRVRDDDLPDREDRIERVAIFLQNLASLRISKSLSPAVHQLPYLLNRHRFRTARIHQVTVSPSYPVPVYPSLSFSTHLYSVALSTQLSAAGCLYIRLVHSILDRDSNQHSYTAPPPSQFGTRGLEWRLGKCRAREGEQLRGG